MDSENLSEELKEKAKACATFEELFALAKEEGLELSIEDLKNISGGGSWPCSDHACNGYTHYVHC